MITWLELDTDPPLAITREPAARPLVPSSATRVAGRLTGVGALRRPMAIPGVYPGEAPNCRVDLDNADGWFTTRWRADPPLRAVARILSDSGELFAGIVTDIDLSTTTRLTLEAGFVRPMSDKMPLRQTTEWGQFEDVRTIPIPYGRTTLEAIPYDAAGLIWVVADGAIAGVDSVTVADVEILAWTWKNGVDRAGKTVAFLTLATPAAEPPAVTLRGRIHPQRGTLIELPDEILWDLLTNVCGLGIAPAAFDAWRSEVVGLPLGGVLDRADITIRAQVDQILQSCGGAWSIAADGIAALWPFVDDDTPTRVDATRFTATDLTPETHHTELVNVLRVRYAYDWAKGEPTQTYPAKDAESIRLYGRLEADWDAGWLRLERQAQALGDRLVAALARPRWTVTWTAPDITARPGDWADITHPASPITGRHRLISAEPDTTALRTVLIAQGIGTPPTPAPTPPPSESYRLTEAGDIRITESGDARILE